MTRRARSLAAAGRRSGRACSLTASGQRNGPLARCVRLAQRPARLLRQVSAAARSLAASAQRSAQVSGLLACCVRSAARPLAASGQPPARLLRQVCRARSIAASGLPPGRNLWRGRSRVGCGGTGRQGRARGGEAWLTMQGFTQNSRFMLDSWCMNPCSMLEFWWNHRNFYTY